MVLSRKGKRTKRRRGATAGTGMHWAVFGEVTEASKEPVLAEGNYADVVALRGMGATWEPKFKISCHSLHLHMTAFPGHAPVVCLLHHSNNLYRLPECKNPKPPPKLSIFLY